jgi:hypothetical protein
MLESLRHIGAARLDERGLTDELRRRHARHQVVFAEACAARLRLPGQVDVFDELDASLPDLRAAQRYLLDAGDHDALLRLALALRDYGYYRLRPEVLRWAAAAAELAEQAGGDRRVAAWAWYVVGESEVHDDPPLAAKRLRRAMEEARRCGASFLLGIAGASAASIEARSGDPADAIAQYRWLLDHWQRAGIRVIQWNMLRAVDELLVRTGSLRAATVLLGALTSTEAGHAVYGDDARRLAAIADAVRAGLDPDEHDAALAEGRVLDDDGAVAVALAAFDAL